MTRSPSQEFQIWAAGPLLVLVIDLLLYGVYTVLFCVCIYVLRGRKSSAYRKFHFITTTILFVLSTIGTGLTIGSMAQFLGVSGSFYNDGASSVNGEVAFDGISMASMIIYVLANCCADIILLFRLYHIWESRKVVVLAPALLTALNLAIGIASVTGEVAPSTEIFYVDNDRTLTAFLGMPKAGKALLVACLVVGFLTNVLLTALIAGRIWWIRRTVTHMGYDNLFQQYNTAFAIFVESGMIYPIILLASLIVVLAVPLIINIFPILIQVVSIAPMLILVRSGLGVSTEGIQQSSNRPLQITKNVRSDADSLYEQKPLYSSGSKGYIEV